MEKDFMGLGVKKEAPHEITDSVTSGRSLAMQWPFSSKVSAPAQFLSFPSLQKERLKAGFESLASNGLVSITKTESFDSETKSNPGIVQTNYIHEKQVGVSYGMTTYPANLLSSSFPMTDPIQAIPTNSHIVGATDDFRNTTKNSSAPSQLTLFYAGSVCVYNNISPEKAQAIMSLAGNCPAMSSPITCPIALDHKSITPPSFLDRNAVKQKHHTIPLTGSWPPAMSGGNSVTTTIMPSRVLTLLPSDDRDPLKVINSPTILSSSTVPQFRRKSLARFLGKRKERFR